jgi:hypothetical protein
VGGISPQGYEVLQVNQFNTMTAAANGLYAANLETWLVSVTQNLNTTVNTGSTLSMTFSGGRARGQAGGKFTRQEADDFIAQLEAEAELLIDTPPEVVVARSIKPTPRATSSEKTVRDLPDSVLAAELQRRGWIVVEP